MNAHGSSPLAPGDRLRCPDCWAPLSFGPSTCAQCGLLLHGAEAQHLWQIDNELAVLHGRTQALRAERTVALRALREVSRAAASSAQAEPAAPARPEQPATPSGPAPAAPARPIPPRPDALPNPGPGPAVELSPRSAQNVILGLGALLVGIAALVFAVWTWSDLGTGARAGVLGLVTLASAGVAIPLHRRGLRATAETFGALAAALLCIDAFALWVLVERITNDAGYAAGALAVIAALLFLYPVLVPLRGPRPVAVVLAQPVPLLLAVSFSDIAGVGALVVVGATALAGALLTLRLKGRGTAMPTGTLRFCAFLLTALTAFLSLSVLVIAGSSGSWNPFEWWLVPLALLLSAVAGLVLARGLGADAWPVVVVSLLLFGAAVLAASGPDTPILPRFPDSLMEARVGTAWRSVIDVLPLGWDEPFLPLGALYLAAPMVAAALSAGAVFLLRRDLLVPLIALVVPPVLLPIPLLTGLPYAVAVVWTVLVGAALVLGSAVAGDRTHAWVPVVTGAVTLGTGLWWGLDEPHVSLAATVLAAATGLAAVLLSRRVLGPDGPGEGLAQALHTVALALASVALLVGLLHLARMQFPEQGSTGQWWMLAAIAFLSGAIALVLGRTRSPFATGESGERRVGFTFAGLFLLAVTPLLTGPDNSPILAHGLATHGAWQAPVATMLDPAHAVLDLPAPAGLAAALGTALGVLAAGALAVGVVTAIDRSLLPFALALAAPPVLVPLPVVLGAPLIVAIFCALVVGAALLLAIARVGTTAAVTGGLTFALAMLWALPQQHTTLLVLLGAAVTVLLSAWTLLSLKEADEKVTGRALATTTVLGCVTLVGSGVALIATALIRDGQGPWWILGATLLVLVASAFVLSTWTGETVFRSFALALVTSVPLVVGPQGAPALAFFPRMPGGAEPDVLLAPAHTVIGVAAEPWPGGLAVAGGLLVAGFLAVGMTALLARRWTTHTFALVAPTTLVPLPVVLHAPFLVALCWTLLVGAGLVLCSSVRPATAAAPWLPGLTGFLTLGLGLSWALVEQYTATGALLFAAVACAVAAALARTAPVAVGVTAAATAATGGAVFTFPLALGLPTEYAAFAVIGLTAGVAAVASRLRSPLLEAAEIPAGLWALVALFTTIGVDPRGGLVALVLALLGVIALASAVRPGRRFLAIVGGLLMLGALWTSLAAYEVSVIEAYTLPPAVAALVIGWEWNRRSAEGEEPSSWLAHAGGLLLLLLPSTLQILADHDLAWRVPVVLAAGLAVVLWGLRARLQAALMLGGLALVVTSLSAFGPPVWDLVALLPNWVPFAAVGGILLAVGARYEANLERLRRLGRMVSAMR